MGLRSHPRGRGPRTSAAAAALTVADRVRPRDAHRSLLHSGLRTASRPLEGAAAVRGMHALPKRTASMKIGVPRETADGETRVALTPQIAGQLVADGHEVLVQAGAGDDLQPRRGLSRGGATIVPDAASLYSQAEMVLRVGLPGPRRSMLRSGSVSSAPWAPFRSRSSRRSSRNAESRRSAWTPSRASPARSRWTCSRRWHGRRLQGRPAGGGLPAELLPAADDGRRNDPAGQGADRWRRRGGVAGDRDGTPAWRSRRGVRHAAGRQGAG